MASDDPLQEFPGCGVDSRKLEGGVPDQVYTPGRRTVISRACQRRGAALCSTGTTVKQRQSFCFHVSFMLRSLVLGKHGASDSCAYRVEAANGSGRRSFVSYARYFSFPRAWKRVVRGCETWNSCVLPDPGSSEQLLP